MWRPGVAEGACLCEAAQVPVRGGLVGKAKQLRHGTCTQPGNRRGCPCRSSALEQVSRLYTRWKIVPLFARPTPAQQYHDHRYHSCVCGGDCSVRLPRSHMRTLPSHLGAAPTRHSR